MLHAITWRAFFRANRTMGAIMEHLHLRRPFAEMIQADLTGKRLRISERMAFAIGHMLVDHAPMCPCPRLRHKRDCLFCMWQYCKRKH